MPPVSYPATQLVNDVVDAPFGGQPANRFGTPARSFIDAVLRFLSQAYITYLRQPYMTFVVTLSSNSNVGDVAVLDEGQFVAASGYYARRAGTGGISLPAQIIGVFLDSGSVGAKARVAFCGIIPPSVTGLGVQSANAHLTCDASSGRLRVASAGEPIIAYADIQGNALLLAPGRLL